MRTVILQSARQDLADGFAFYNEKEESVGGYFLESLFSDIVSLRLYAGVHRKSIFKDKLAIRAAWWPILSRNSPLSFDLLLVDPHEHIQRSQRGSAYYQEITGKSLRLV